MAMTIERYIEQAKYEGKTEAQITRSNRGADYMATEEWARKAVVTKWVRNFLSQKDLPGTVKDAFIQAFIDEMLATNPR